jgi:hypothetical protein
MEKSSELGRCLNHKHGTNAVAHALSGYGRSESFLPTLVSSVYYTGSKGGRATLKMLRRKSKTRFVNPERNLQDAIALLNFLKHIAPQQLMLRR